MKKELAELMKVSEEEIDVQMEAYAAEIHDTHGDAQFAAWFLSMLTAYGPEWAMALEAVDPKTGTDLVEGGRDVLKRWNGILAKRATNGLE